MAWPISAALTEIRGIGMGMTDRSQNILGSLLAVTKKARVDAADALFVENVSASVSYRLGKLEDAERCAF
jgi:hypothetical protein